MSLTTFDYDGDTYCAQKVESITTRPCEGEYELVITMESGKEYLWTDSSKDVAQDRQRKASLAWKAALSLAATSDEPPKL